MQAMTRKLLGVAALSAAFLSTPAHGAVNLTFTNPGSVAVGSLFDVDLIATGLETTELSAFDIDVSFDESVVDFESYSLGDELTDPFFGQEDWSLGEYMPGVVNVAEVSWLDDFSAQPDLFVLASLTFEAVATGTADFGIAYSDLADADGGVLDAVVPGQVAVVPLPGAAFLFAGALAALGVVRRRTQA